MIVAGSKLDGFLCLCMSTADLQGGRSGVDRGSTMYVYHTGRVWEPNYLRVTIINGYKF